MNSRLASTFALSAVGNVLLWAALPPLSLSPLAWLAPVPWIWLVRRPQLEGRRPLLMLWLTSFAFWLAVLYWMTLPHWATSIGWIALSCYLAAYLPLFVALSRTAVHTLKISPLIAAPVVWTGLEVCRTYFLSGFAMASIAHTQSGYPIVIQISDLAGGYAVCFLMVFVAACLARALPCGGTRRAWWPMAPAAAAIALTLAYGNWRLSQETTSPGPTVGLVQGSIDIEMKHDPTQAQRIYKQYIDLSRKLVKDNPGVDLIVWPETMFRYPWFTFDKDFRPPADAKWTTAEAEASSRKAIETTVAAVGVPMLLGIESVHETPHGIERFNSALFTDAEGAVTGRYDKCHPVAFGEYIPLAATFPFLYRLTPLAGGLSSGAAPLSLELAGTRYSPDICYENTVPHLVRSQVAQLRAEGHEPDVLINLTNDGWFWGSSELDMHLACAVFRAVECRKPFLVAANTGFSAWVDSNGRIVERGPRRATGLIIAKTDIDHRRSWYLSIGDVPGMLCLAACGGLALVQFRHRAKKRQPASAA